MSLIIKSMLLFFMSISLLASCATSENNLTQENIDKANMICERQVNTDKALRVKTWFTNWLECKKEKVMPFEIAIYPEKEKGIRTMYDRLLLLGINVDAGITKVESVYEEWDNMEYDLKIKSCPIRINNADGSSLCYK